MKRTTKQQSLIVWTMVLALFLISVASLSMLIAAPIGANTEAAAEAPVLGTVTVTGATSAVNPTVTVTLGGVTWYKVETAGQFVYAATHSGDEDRRFLLMKNFVITGNGGYSCNRRTIISGAIYDDGVKTDYSCKITYTPTNDYSHRSSGTSGGLFGTFAGYLYDTNFVFNGTIHALGSVNYGGFAGIMSGDIIHCNMASSGTVMLYGNDNDKTIYGGGLFGQLTGKVLDKSTLTMNGTVDVRNFYINKEEDEDSQNNDAKDNKLYAGGIAGGGLEGGKIDDSTINIYGTVATSDATKKTVLGFYNDDESVFPSGGVVGLAENITITKSTIMFDGSTYANGGKSTSKDGAMSGGVVGYLSSSLYFTQNVVTIGENARISARSARQAPFSSFNGNIHKGGIVGRKTGGGSFQHNVLSQQRDSGLIDGAIKGEDYGDNDYKGILLGSGTMVGWNSGNFWLIRRVGEFTQPLVQNGNGNTGILHYLNLYGGGNIEISIKNQQIRFDAKMYTSPFHEWLSSIPNNTKYVDGTHRTTALVNGVTVQTDYFQPRTGLATSTTVNAVFLTKDINESGNLVQFADEMNSGLNQTWVSVELKQDIAFEVGMPIINEFKGKFKGNNHTITFNSGSTIMGSSTDSNVGMFAKLTSNAIVENVKIVFSGTLSGGTVTDGVADIADINVGIITGYNEGTISNVSLLLSQGGKIVSVSSSSANVGGIAGHSVTAISKAEIIIEGKLEAQSNTVYLGGMVGTAASTSEFSNINIAVRGELLANLKSGDKFASVGGFAGRTTGAVLSTRNFVITVKDVSNFKNDVLRALNATTSHKGAIAGLGSVTKSLTNTWLTASYEQYMSDGEHGNGEKVIRLFNSDANVYGANRIYINGGIVDCVMDIAAATPAIRFSVPHDTSRVFTGWFNNYNCSEMVGAEHLAGSDFVPQGQSGAVFFSAVISSMIMSYDNLKTIAITTNAGQSYSGIEFILGTEIIISAADSYIPIGTRGNPFRGIFDGKSLGIKIQGGMSTGDNTMGLFGCIGEGGIVKQLNVTIDSDIGAEEDITGGVIAAYNNGTIGQDSSSNKVVVNINKTLTGNIVGGIAGINEGVIKNVEVNFNQSSVNPSKYGRITASGLEDFVGSDANGIGGGIVGLNRKEGILKNAIVSYNVIDPDPVESRIFGKCFSGTTYVGGIVGYNSGKVYSTVCEVELDEEGRQIAAVFFLDGGEGNGVAATLIGYNDVSSDTDAVWALYVQSDPFALPNPDMPLITGKDSAKGNKLIRYGGGDIISVIEDNNVTQPYGGAITFRAIKVDQNFYNYTASLSTGELVSAFNGAAGSNLSPTVTTAGKPGLSGVTYYGVFVNTEIANSADFYAMAANINSGFSAHANYILNIVSSSELKLFPSDTGYTSVGRDSAFVGNFNGNGYLIRLFIDSDNPLDHEGRSLFGTISATSIVQNFSYDIEVGIVLREGSVLGGSNTAIGFVADINYGQIANVNVKTYAVIEGNKDDAADYAGGIAGYNDGTIKNVGISYMYLNDLGNDYAGIIYGYNAGGVAGYNSGTIGSEYFDNVKVNVHSGALVPGIEGLNNVGGIVGVNDGTIRNTNTKLYGKLEADDINSYGGGVAGTNNTVIDSAVVKFYATGLLAVRGNIGGIAGYNAASARIGNNSVADGISFVNEATMESSPATAYGGIAAYNYGQIFGVIAEQSGIARANDYAGGIAAVSSGTIRTVEFVLKTSGRISANVVGGAVGVSSGNIYLANVTVNGVVGRAMGVSKAGGLAGQISAGKVYNSLVYLTRDVLAATDGKKGLLAGESIASAGVNTWAYAYNSIRTLASTSASTGFNALKIVGNDTVIGTLSAAGAVSFKAMNSPYMWYTDISTQSELGNMANDTYMPDQYATNQLHHVSYYNLKINNAADLVAMYRYINSNDLFNGVMFKLMKDIEITTTLQPIGTEENKFTGIFDGNYKTITFGTYSGIAGTAYSGLFGYASKDSIIRNFIVQVNKDVILGAGTSTDAGVIVGKSEGRIENVGLNLEATPFVTGGITMGGFAGELTESSVIVNCWAVIYNQSVPTVKEGGSRGVNSLGVLGSGILRMTFSGTRFFVEIDAAEQNADSYFGLFDNWYANIATRQLVTAVQNYAAVYGAVTKNIAGRLVNFMPIAVATNLNITASFISLDINTAAEFYNFANNINTYSDQGASFVLKAHIVVNYAEFEPVGTLVHPFTGSFDGQGNTITVVGDLVDKNNVYSGLFGYVERTAVISNLIIRADYASRYGNPTDYKGQTIGDFKSIYSGFAVSLLKGKLEQVVVVLQTDTVIYNVNADSRGGIVGMVDSDAVMSNSWVVLPEFYTISAVGGVLNGAESPAMPNVLYQCGVGGLQIRIEDYLSSGISYKQVIFDAIKYDYGSNIYGFVDNKVIDDVTVPESTLIAKSGEQNWNDREILVLFLNNTIATYTDLQNLAAMINSGRNYKGVVYQQTQDITISSDYVPIGGQIKISSGSVGSEYKIIEFAGGYNGNGRSIIIPSTVTISARYAGIFGITGKDARISNLKLVAMGKVGNTNLSNSEYTRYAGFLTGVNYGASFKNIIVEMDKNAQVLATIESGRFAGVTIVTFNAVYEDETIVGWEGLNIAENCWVLNYNSRFNALLNASEQLFNNTIDAAIADALSSGATKLTAQGRYNGGINVLTVVAAGEFTCSFGGENTIQFTNYDTGNPAKEWYYYDDLGEKQALALSDFDMYNADKTLQNKIYYASFLDSDIDSLGKLTALAKDTNAGYDLYGLTFNLIADIVIDVNTYAAIGNDNGGFNAIFDGKGNRIIVANGVLIEGKYAGIFGNVGEDGKVMNLIVEINGTLGRTNYSESQLSSGKVRTVYAGAIAYTKGETRNVIVIGYNAAISYVLQDGSGISGAGGIGIGYDDTNLVYNSWAITKASNNISAYGRVNEAIGDSSINVMKVIGMGALALRFEYDADSGDYIVVMENDTSIGEGRFSVLGWYGNYAKDNQLSSTLGISHYNSVSGRYEPLTTGVDGSYKANSGIINSRFEVLIMSTVITTVDQLESIEADVNIGGYSFENLEFSLAADIDILKPIKIGTSTTQFRGTFTGSYNGVYYTITLLNGTPLFGYSSGVMRNMTVILRSKIYEFGGTVGAIAAYNAGTIESTIVVIDSGAEIKGATVGGLAGYNSGTITNSAVIIKEGALLAASAYAGGLVGRNAGNIIGSSQSEETYWKQMRSDSLETILRKTGEDSYEDYLIASTVLVLGSIEADTDEEADTFAGGIAGLSDGYAIINRVIVRIASDASIVARGANVAVGGLVGRSRATLRNSVVYNEGIVSAVDNGKGTIKLLYRGDFVGDISGSAINSWLISPVPPAIIAVGNGYISVNVLQINGDGKLDVSIDSANSILFFDITEYGGAIIDGWYLNNDAPITDKIGNSNKEEGTFKPNSDIMGRVVSVVYINTQLSTVQDIITMAKTVNNGLYNDNILFTLQNDIEFTNMEPLTVSIGTKTATGDYGFKHTFDGQGYTITFTNDSLAVSNYLGLFGYVANGAKIRNLNVVYKSNAGLANFGNSTPYSESGAELMVSRFFGGIAGENGGTIENCTVTIGTNCRLNGVNVGGVAGINAAGGRILETNLTNNGTIRSESYDAYNAYAGGVAGTNSGEIGGTVADGAVSCVISHSGSTTESAVYAKAKGSGSAYAGGIAGSNTNKIHTTDLFVSRKVLSESTVSCYAGGVAGSNTGTISKLYITLTSTANIGHPDSSATTISAGGIVGINVNKVSDVLVNITATGVVADSAISVHKDNSPSKSNISNVWVYNNNTALNSKIAVVNNMTYSATVAVSHSAKITEIIGAGNIIFYASLYEDGKITMLQNMNRPSEVLLENISYSEGPDSKLVYTSNAGLTGISANAVTRRTFNSGSELKAFSYAYNTGVQVFSGEYSLGSDITLPQGEYIPIGTAARPFGASLIFDGKYHKITVGANVTFGEYSSIFAYNRGAIVNLAVQYDRTITGNKSGGIAVYNSTALGKIERVAVYISKGVTVSNPISYSTETAHADAWVISGNNMEAVTAGNNIYKVIVVNGDGSLTFNYDSLRSSIVFEAVEKEDVKFAGWGNGNVIISQYTDFLTEQADLSKYSAEFLSTNIDTLDKLLVLNDLLMMRYDSNGESFNITADFEIDIALNGFKSATPFMGVIDGMGHILTISEGATSIFGAAQGTIKNVILDHTTVPIPLFTASATVTLTNVIVLNNNASAIIASGASPSFTAQKVFVVTNNPLSVTSSGVGVILTNATVAMQYAFSASGINATAVEGLGQVFAGWFSAGALLSNNFMVSLVNDKDYEIVFIKNIIESKDELLALAAAVANNFTLAEYFFELDTDIVIDEGFMQIGTATSSFAGSIDGAGYSVTVSEAQRSLFKTFAGTLSNLIVVYDDSCLAATVIAEVIASTASLTQVVGVSEGRAGFANSFGGTLTNCWLIAQQAPEFTHEIAGMNTLVAIDAEVTVALDGADVELTIVASDESKFLVWYNEIGKALNISGYDKYVSSNDSRVYLFVTSINEIKASEEFSYLSTAIAHGFAGDVTLGADIVLPADFVPVINYTGTFDGRGHSLDLSAITESKTIFASLAAATVRNTIFITDTEETVTLTVASGTGSVENSVVILGGNADADAVLNAINVWLLTDNLTIDSGFTSYMYHSNGTINASIDLVTYKIEFVSLDNNDYYFMGYEIYDGLTVVQSYDVSYYGDTAGLSVVSYYAPKVIDNVLEWNVLAYAVNDLENRGEGKTFTLGTSITVDGTFNAIASFEGAFDGAFNSIVFADESYGGLTAIISLAADGAIRNLALVLNIYTELELLPDSGVTNCWVIYYEDEAGVTITEEEDAVLDPSERVLYTGGARLIQVSEGGYIDIGHTETAFKFTPQPYADNCYALRQWSYRDGATYTAFNENGGNALAFYVPDAEDAVNLKIWFDKKYRIEVVMEGVNENAAFKPVITPSAEYWQDYAEPVQIKCTDPGNGYILWGFYYEGTPEIKTTMLIVDVGALSGHITVRASFEPFATKWERAEYTGNNITLTLAQEATLIDYGCEINTTYKYGANTPPLVDGAPYHVGSYTVEYRISKDGLDIGFGVSGLEITPKTLRFLQLIVPRKTYDGNSAVLVNPYYELTGFVADDKFSDLDLRGVKFEYDTKNAGLRYVRITEDAALNPASDSFTYLNYRLDDSERLSIVSAVTGAPIKTVTAQIDRRPLEVSVSTQIIKYLDQYEEGYLPIFEPDIPNKNVGGNNINYICDGDIIDWENVFKIVDNNELSEVRNAGEYAIGIINSLNEPNYIITLYNSDAKYIIEPSPIAVVLEPMSIQYGDADTVLKYYITAEGYSQLDLSGFRLNLSYSLGGGSELIPEYGEDEYAYAYSVMVKYLATNVNFVLSDKAQLDLDPSSFEFDGNNRRVYLLTTENILQVTPRRITVTADNSSNTKEFGVVAETYSGRVSGGTLAYPSHKLVMTREAGERVNSTGYKPEGYRLSFAVYHDGVDVTEYYDINEGAGYYYTIAKTKVKLALRSWGSSTYVYGDTSAMSDMAYSPVFNRNVTMESMFAASGASGTNYSFAGMGINLKLGYFGSEIPNVGTYTASINVSYANGKEYLADCVEFVSDAKNCDYEVIKQQVVVTMANVSRYYNTSADISSTARIASTVGIINADKSKITVENGGFYRLGTSSNSANAGTYNYSAAVTLKANSSAYAYLLDNYTLKVVNGNITINPISVTVNVKIGYFDDGVFVPMKAGYYNADAQEFVDENSMFFADKRAQVYFEIGNINHANLKFLRDAFPEGATELEKQAIIIDVLRLQYTNPWLLPVSGTKSYASAASMNTNVSVTFTDNASGFYVLPVTLSIVDAKGIIKLGELKPTLIYTVLAKNEYDTVIGSITINGNIATINALAGMDYNYFLYTEEVLKTQIKKVTSDNADEYKLEISINENGEWIPLSDSGAYSPDGGAMSPQASFSITEENDIYSKITKFIKENMILVSAVGAGLVAIIIVVLLLAAGAIRKKRLLAAATRELISKDAAERATPDDSEETAEGEENAADGSVDESNASDATEESDSESASATVESVEESAGESGEVAASEDELSELAESEEVPEQKNKKKKQIKKKKK